MTRKDYEAIARAIRDASVDQWGAVIFPVSGETMQAEIAGRIATIMAADNPRFDRGRFLKACGVAS